MRSLLAALLWLVTTALLAVTVPALWAQQNVVSVDGYAELATSAGRDRALQQPMAAELTDQITAATGTSGNQATLIGAAEDLNLAIEELKAIHNDANEELPGDIAHQVDHIAATVDFHANALRTSCEA